MTDVHPHKILRYVLSDFEGLKPIEHGSGGIISIGKLDDFGQIALKQFICSEEDPLEKYKKEIDILVEYKHPNIVHLYGILWDGVDKSRYLGYIMEYSKGGSLHKVIHDSTKNYGKMQMCIWIEQIARGLQFLHKHGIIHRDIKPANILICGDMLKLADFGIAKNVNGTTTAGSGTYRYMAPEILNFGKCSPASDIYSLGITIWELFHRELPYREFEEVTGYITLLSKIIGGVRPVIAPDKVNEDVEKLIEKCWHANIDSRPPIKEIIDYFGKKAGKHDQRSQKELSIFPEYHPKTEGLLFEEKQSTTILILGGMRDPDSNFQDECMKNVAILSSDRSKWIGVEFDLVGMWEVAVYLNEDMYIIFGYMAEIYKVDKNLMKRRRLADMDTKRSEIQNSCLAWNGYIWIFGGRGINGKSLKSVERYDPTYGRWTFMPDMKYCRHGAAATIWNNRIIISGGIVDNDFPSVVTNTVECYNPEDGCWTNLPKMPNRLAYHSLVSYNGKLLAIGGNDSKTIHNDVWELDLQERYAEWKPLMTIREPSCSFSGVVLDNEVYVIGGSNENPLDYLDRVEIFDGEHWRTGPSLYLGWKNMSSVIIPQSLADRICAYKPLQSE